MNVKIVKLKKNATIPTKANPTDAGYDLYACIDKQVQIRAHTTEKIGTGVAIASPHGYFGAIFARSGLSTKNGLRPSNCVGVCDEPYRGEYIVALHNDTDLNQYVNPGDRIAQLVFLPYLDANFEEVETLDETERGAEGFGSTGK